MTKRLPPAPAPGRRSRLILFAVSCLLALGVAELGVRLVLPQMLIEGEDFYQSDPVLGWTNRPSYESRFSNLVDFDTTVRIDSLGLRVGADRGLDHGQSSGSVGDELTGRRPAVLGLGDSFMFGFGVEAEESFLAAAAATVDAAAINAGVPGYDLCQAVDLAERLMPQVGALDAIVIAPCLANDERDAALGRGRVEVQHGHFIEPGVRFEPDSWRRRLVHPFFAHLHLVRFLRYSPAAAWVERQLHGKESIDRRSLQGLLAAYLSPPPPEILEGGARSGECLGRLRQSADEKGIPLLGLLIPDEIRIRREALVAAARAAGLQPEGMDPDGPRRRMIEILSANGIEVVDPTAALVAGVAAGQQLWFRSDRHFTRAGSAIVGRVLAEALKPHLARTGAAKPEPETVISRFVSPPAREVSGPAQPGTAVDDRRPGTAATAANASR